MVKNWMGITLLWAGIYNIVWGTWVVLFPMHVFELTGATPPKYPELWQCVGMIVAVYGLGYLIAGTAPLKHWPIVLVGFLGKIFGPIGFVVAINNNVFPLEFGWNIVFNDLIWWIPFGMILYRVSRRYSKASMRTIKEEEFKNFEDRDRARFINSLSGFKSANLIGTADNKGNTNLCIISSAFHLGANPALMGFIIRPDSVPRDTLTNLREGGVCSLNHVHHSFIEKAHQTSARYPKDLSEFDACLLTPMFIDGFPAPFVAESNIKMGLKVIREEKLPENGTHLIIAQIVDVHIPSDCLHEDGRVDIEKAGSVCVAGLDTYYEGQRLKRFSYAKPGLRPKSLED